MHCLQSSADLPNAAPTQEALEVLARVREALPRLREASDLAIDKQPSDNLDIMYSVARSLSGEFLTGNSDEKLSSAHSDAD